MNFKQQLSSQQQNIGKTIHNQQNFNQAINNWEEFFQLSIGSEQISKNNNLLDLIWKDQGDNIELEKQQLQSSYQDLSKQFTSDNKNKGSESQQREGKSFSSMKNSKSLFKSKRKSQKIYDKSRALRLFIKSKINFQKTYGQKLQFDQPKIQQKDLPEKETRQKNIYTLKQQLIFSRYNMYQKKSKFIFQQSNKNHKKTNSKDSLNDDSFLKNGLKLTDSQKLSSFQNELFGPIGVKSSCFKQKIMGPDYTFKNLIVSKIYGEKKTKTQKKRLIIQEKNNINDQHYMSKLQNQQNKIIQRKSEFKGRNDKKNSIIKPTAIFKRESVSQNFKRSNQLIIRRKKQFKNPLIPKIEVQKQYVRGRSVQCDRKSIQKIIIESTNKQKLKTQQDYKEENKKNCQAKRELKNVTIQQHDDVKMIIRCDIITDKMVNFETKNQKIQEKNKFKFQKEAKQYYEAMQRFNVKLGYIPSTFLLIFDSRDNRYIVKNLLSNNWKLNTKNNSQYFILKWVYLPSSLDLKHLKNGQFYNHFKNAHQITSKAYLSKNLTANTHRFRKINNYFPKSFDIGKKCQNQQFLKEYQQNIVLILLKRLFLACYQYKQSLIIELFLNFQAEQAQSLIKDSQFQQVLQSKNFNILDFENFKEKNKQFVFNINAVISVLKFCRFQRKKNQLDPDQNYNFLNWSQQQFNKQYQILQAYYESQNLTTPCPQKKLHKQFYSTPSDLLIKCIVKQFVYFNKSKNWLIRLQNLKKAGQGNDNVWIIKPGSNARGNGIYLQKSLNLIMSSVKGIQSRIVQKYIQRPLLLTKSSDDYYNNRKFDFRQWVLVKSLDPLQIYMFSHCYVRFCSQKYDLNNIKNMKSHLTNYSLNKGGFPSNDKSVLGIDKFKIQLKQNYNVDWDQLIKPRIRQIIIQSVLSCQQKIQSSDNGTCFQLFGYDILIDQNFNPWLIQVNMSPACQQRTEQLSQYIQSMNKQLLSIIFPPQYIPNLKLNPNGIFKWEKIYHQNYQFGKKDTDLKLEIVGNNIYQNMKAKNNQSKYLKSSPNKKQKRKLNQNDKDIVLSIKKNDATTGELKKNHIKDEFKQNNSQLQHFIEQNSLYQIQEQQFEQNNGWQFGHTLQFEQEKYQYQVKESIESVLAHEKDQIEGDKN